MARRDARHGDRRAPGHPMLRALGVLVVLALVAGGVAAWHYDLLDRWLDHPAPAASKDPAAVPPPAGLDLPALRPPPALAAAVSTMRDLDPAAVRRALAPYLRDRDLGPHVLASVTQLDGTEVLRRGTGTAIPASVTKLLTGISALDVLGPEHTFTTRVVSGAGDRIVLVGGGDPFLASQPPDPATYPFRADVATLARRTARALAERGRTRVRVSYDDSLFSGPDVDKAWPADYITSGVIAPISALWVDEGRTATGGRVAEPPMTAATTYAAALQRAGVRVVGSVSQVPAATGAGIGGPELAAVHSAPLREILARVLDVSDNEGAEVLAHQVGLATTGSGSFAGGVQGVRRTLRRLGVPLTGIDLNDGSGLSREDLLTPTALGSALRVALSPDHPELRTVATALPVAGFTGSLAQRFDDADPAARGRVRAKTGTLTGVSSLVGVATDLQGNPMVFVLLADKIDPVDSLDARQTLDNAAGALGACRCGA